MLNTKIFMRDQQCPSKRAKKIVSANEINFGTGVKDGKHSWHIFAMPSPTDDSHPVMVDSVDG